jgi:Zn-dependent protease
MLTKSIRLFSIFGFRISLDASWIFLAALIVWSLATGYFPDVMPGLSPVVYYVSAAVAALGMFASIVYHELAHSLVARYYQIRIAGITLFIFGGVAELADEPPTAKSEFLVAVAGPISSVLLAGVLFLITNALPDSAPREVFAVLGYLTLINVVLAVFNLMPAFPLDGGRMLRAGLWWYQGNLTRATRIASYLGAALGIALMAYGAYNASQDATVGGMWQILIGFFIFTAAGNERRQTEMMENLRGISVGQLMRSAPVTVPGDTPVEEITARNSAGERDIVFPVTDDGRMVGLVRLSALEKIPPAERAATPVRDQASPLTEAETVTPGQSAIAALRQLGRARGNQAFFLQDGHIAGWIRAHDIFAFIEHRNAARAAEAGHPVA